MNKYKQTDITRQQISASLYRCKAQVILSEVWSTKKKKTKLMMKSIVLEIIVSLIVTFCSILICILICIIEDSIKGKIKILLFRKLTI